MFHMGFVNLDGRRFRALSGLSSMASVEKIILMFWTGTHHLQFSPSVAAPHCRRPLRQPFESRTSPDGAMVRGLTNYAEYGTFRILHAILVIHSYVVRFFDAPA